MSDTVLDWLTIAGFVLTGAIVAVGVQGIRWGRRQHRMDVLNDRINNARASRGNDPL